MNSIPRIGTAVWLFVVTSFKTSPLMGQSCPCPFLTPILALHGLLVHDGPGDQLIVPLIFVVSTCTTGAVVPLNAAFAGTPSSLLG